MASPIPIKTAAQVREDILRVIRNRRQDAPLGADDDEVVRANAAGVAIEGAYLHQQWVLRQFFPQTADWDYLLLHAKGRANMTPKVATTASGRITVTGTPDTPIAAGGQITLNGITWTSTESVVLDEDGVASMAVMADAPGAAGNLVVGTKLTWIATPAGALSQVTVITLGGGTDDEQVEELRTRLMFALANPDGTGTLADLKRWALEVDGVTAAYVYPKRRGLGTADVCIISADGVPSLELCNEVWAYIENKATTQGDRRVFGPAEQLVDMIIQVAFVGLTLGDAQMKVQAVVTAFFAALGPGEGLILKQLEAQIMAINGITDVRIVTPAANVPATADDLLVQWLRKGETTVGHLV